MNCIFCKQYLYKHQGQGGYVHYYNMPDCHVQDYKILRDELIYYEVKINGVFDGYQIRISAYDWNPQTKKPLTTLFYDDGAQTWQYQLEKFYELTMPPSQENIIEIVNKIQAFKNFQ